MHDTPYLESLNTRVYNASMLMLMCAAGFNLSLCGMCKMSSLFCQGGLGLAAIQIARAAGAGVLATAGSIQKRVHLRKQGVRDVLSSRDLHFAEQLGRSRKARPSIVLNSLTSPGVSCG